MRTNIVCYGFLAMFLFNGQLLFGESNPDSLWHEWHDQAQTDSNRLDAMDLLITRHYIYTKPDSAFILAQMEYELAASIQHQHRMATSLNLLGASFQVRGRLNEALPYFEESLSLRQDMSDQKGSANVLNNIGVVHILQGKPKEAISFFEQALDIKRIIKDSAGIGSSLGNIGNVYRSLGEYETAIDYYQQALPISKQLQDVLNQANLLNNIGNIYKEQGKNDTALTYYQDSYALHQQLGNASLAAKILNNIGLIYKNQGNYPMAVTYFTQLLAASERQDDQESIAIALNNLGNMYYTLDDLDLSYQYHQRSLRIAIAMGDHPREALTYNSLALVYEERGMLDSAFWALQKSRTIHQAQENKVGLTSVLINLGRLHEQNRDRTSAIELYQEALDLQEQHTDISGMMNTHISYGNVLYDQQRFRLALKHGQQALTLAKDANYVKEIALSAHLLYRIYSTLGQKETALNMLEMYTINMDSLNRAENHRAILRQSYQYEYDKQALADSLEYAKEEALKDLEIQKQQINLSRQRIGLIATGIGLCLIIALAIAIQRGKKRSEELLLNILPYETAQELKHKGFAEAREFDEATILFSDFKGFTRIAAQLSARELVAEIDHCFKAFDDIMTTYGLEKIKTIGDAYMAAGGLPDPLGATIEDVIKAGLEMQQFMQQRIAEQQAAQLPYFEMRVGIHTGPVVAGIVGVKKFQYDVWGDTVNIASRMESHGAVGQVNISKETYRLLQDVEGFTFIAREAIEVKGKGKMQMYFVEVSE
ncbi:MAG: tetratricopeptide repeat protein [Bacteroidota bacterium]